MLGAVFFGDGALDGHATTVAVGLLVVQVGGVAGQAACDIEGLRHGRRSRSRQADLLLALRAEVLEAAERLVGCWGERAIAEAVQGNHR